MLKFGNKEFRNLQEQVLKNMQNIANIKEGTAVLDEFGIKVVGEVDSLQDLPSVIEYKAAHEDWEYGDAFAIGTEPPYTLVILTRANDEITADHWFDIGDFPAPGPQGATGPQGEVGPQGPQGNQGDAGVDAGFGSILATAQTLPAGSVATATVVASGPNTAKEFSFTFGIPRGADGGQASWGNILGDLEDQTDLQDALDDKQDTLVSGTNIKTINNQSVIGSGNIEINSGVWGNITGTLSNQTDLANALAEKQPVIDASHKLSASYVSGLATVATTGAYSDLSGTPTIGTGTITIKKNGDTIDSFGLNQTSDQNINITVPTKVSDLTNDSGFATVSYVDGELADKQDVISDLSTIRSGAAAGATAVQPATLQTELATKQDVISDLATIRSGAAAGATAVQPAAIADMATETWVGQQDYATNTALTNGLATKQDTISDLSTIRSGAALGATAVQPSSLATVATTGDYSDLINIPSNIVTTDTSQEITGYKRFTSNQGILCTSININNTLAHVYIIDPTNKHSIYISSNNISYTPDTDDSSTRYTISLPEKTGTIALTNDLSAYVTKAGGTSASPEVITGFKRFNENVLVESITCPDTINTVTLEVGDIVPQNTNYSIAVPSKSGTMALISDIPTNNNQLTNGAGYQTASDVSTAISGQTKETWTFTLSDGTTTTKTVVLG